MAEKDKDPVTIELAKSLKNVPWCDDYEKMISGVLYDPLAPELVEGRFHVRRLIHRYNSHFPDDATAQSLKVDRERMLKQMLGRVGNAPFVEPPLRIDYGCNIIIGDSFYSNFNLVILDCGIVKIGDRVIFGPFVSIFAATHETDVQSRRDEIEYARSVTIGDDCWIGGNTTIIPGVTIGKGCTIGAGSVVTCSIPEFSVAIGSPARVTKSVPRVQDHP